MWAFELQHIVTGERAIIFGYNQIDAFRRIPELDPDEWQVISFNYED